MERRHNQNLEFLRNCGIANSQRIDCGMVVCRHVSTIMKAIMPERLLLAGTQLNISYSACSSLVGHPLIHEAQHQCQLQIHHSIVETNVTGVLPTSINMCHQVIKIFECGHSSEPVVIKCNKSTPSCNEVFLRPELQNADGLCQVLYIYPYSTL